ncbi:MAG: hypothetical protein K6G91_05135 [Kiritimatiellae bacterium]|nr:hypothetical protein [Kiritimatiellia bacterium]
MRFQTHMMAVFSRIRQRPSTLSAGSRRYAPQCVVARMQTRGGALRSVAYLVNDGSIFSLRSLFDLRPASRPA